MHEAQRYKTSLEPSSVPAPRITWSKGYWQETRSETSTRSHKTKDFKAWVFENRSRVSNKLKENRRKKKSHISLKIWKKFHTKEEKWELSWDAFLFSFTEFEESAFLFSFTYLKVWAYLVSFVAVRKHHLNMW